MKSPFDRYQELQSYVGWTDEDARRVAALGPLVATCFHPLIDDFYEVIEKHPEASKVITGGLEQISRLKQTLRDWLADLFSGRYDRAYVDRRWRVGSRHVEIGLNQMYTNAALSRLRRGLLKVLESTWSGSMPEFFAARTSLNMLLDLDLAIIEDAYQTEYQRRQAVAERLATLGKISGGIAHELRNPLNVVQTSVYYLLNAKNATEEKKRDHLQRIERQVGVADNVITALNDFARLPVPQMEPVEVDSFLRTTLEINPLPKTILLETHIQSPGLLVLGDREQLLIVFGNLIRNARDAMPEGGVLRLIAERYDEYVTIKVCDSGKGISPEHLPHILEPLYSTKAKGIGLGLSITRDIIQRHHGVLTFSSEPGAGATFAVQLVAA